MMHKEVTGGYASLQGQTLAAGHELNKGEQTRMGYTK